MNLNSLGKDPLSLILYYSCDRRSIISFHESCVSLSLVCKDWLRVIKGDIFKGISVKEMKFIFSGRHPLRVRTYGHYSFAWRDYMGIYNFRFDGLKLEIFCESRNEFFKFQSTLAVFLGKYLILYNKEFLIIYYETMSNIVYKTEISMLLTNSHNVIESLIGVKGGFITFLTDLMYPSTYKMSKVDLKTFEIKQSSLDLPIRHCGYFGVYYNEGGCLMRTSWEQIFSLTSENIKSWKKIGKKIMNENFCHIYSYLSNDVMISTSHIYGIGDEGEILWSRPFEFSDTMYRVRRYDEFLYIYSTGDFRFETLIESQTGKIINISETFSLGNLFCISLDPDMLGYTLHI